MRKPVKAQAETVVAQIIACEQEAAISEKNVDLVEFDHKTVAQLWCDNFFEANEVLRQNGGDVEVEAERHVAADAVAYKHVENATIKRLRQILEEPAIGAQVDAWRCDVL